MSFQDGRSASQEIDPNSRDVEIEPGRFGDGKDVELARAQARGDRKTVAEISMHRTISYLREEEGRSSGGPMHDSNSPLLNPGKRGLGQFRD